MSATETTSLAPWPRWKLIGFRFLFVYILFSISQWFTQTIFPNGSIKRSILTPLSEIGLGPDWLKQAIYPTACRSEFGAHLCWIADDTWLLFVAALITILWTLLARRKREYRRLNEVFRSILRFYVIADMVDFAVAKFLVVQFGVGPEGIDLVTPLGDWQGGTVMWRSMGESSLFGVFTGFGEAAAAILLLRRRTTTLGAMVLLMVTSTIFVYDIVATHHYSKLAWEYMMIAVILMAPDAKRMYDFYVRNRPAEPAKPTVTMFGGRFSWILETAIAALFVWLRVFPLDTTHYWRQKPNFPLIGLYEVETFLRNGRPVPPRLTDTTRWQYLDIASEGGGGRYRRHQPPMAMKLHYIDGSADNLQPKIDTAKNRIIVVSMSWGRDTARLKVGTLHYVRMGDSLLAVRSVLRGDTINALLRRVRDDVSVLRGGPGYVPLPVQHASREHP